MEGILADGISVACCWREPPGRPRPRAPSRRRAHLPRTTAPTFPVAGASPALEVTRLSDNLMVVSGAGGNVTLALGPDSALLVNGGDAAASPALLAEVARARGRQAGADALQHRLARGSHRLERRRWARPARPIIAHEFTKQYLGTDDALDWQGGKTYKPRAPQALPTKTFYTTGSMTFGGETIDYGHLGQAHTDGDIYVFFRDANVLVAGDVLTVGQYPIADYTRGGWLGGMVTATKTLLDLTNARHAVRARHRAGADARRPAGAARHAVGDARPHAQDDAAGHGRRRHAGGRRHQGVRRRVGASRAVRDGVLSRDVAARARAGWGRLGACETRLWHVRRRLSRRWRRSVGRHASARTRLGRRVRPRPCARNRSPPPDGRVAAPPSRALLDSYCVACHNQRVKTAGLAFDNVGSGATSASTPRCGRRRSASCAAG